MANDQDLILLNVTAKNGKPYSGQIAVDVHDITNPIVDGGGSPVIVHVKNSTVRTLGDTNNVDAWTVSDSLSTIANQDLNFAILPITKIDSRGTQHPTTYATPKNILFYLPNIVGAAEAVISGGCSFPYNIQGDPIPVRYYSSLTVAQLITTAPIGGITSVNGNTGPAVTLTVISTAVGQTLTWSGTVLQMPTAGSTTPHGLLTSADWTTFSNKVGGSGATNHLPKMTGINTIGNSQVFDDGTNVGINELVPTAKLHIVSNGDTTATNSLFIANSSSATIAQIRDDGGAAIGLLSSIASGSSAPVALGYNNTSSGIASLATGFQTTASGAASFSGGQSSVSSANYAFAFGESCTASASYAVAIGRSNAASGGSYAIALGGFVKGTGQAAMTIGTGITGSATHLENSVINSILFGFESSTGTTRITGSSLDMLAGTVVNLAACTTSSSSLMMPAGTAPSVLADGMIYFDGTHFYGVIGGVAKQLDN